METRTTPITTITTMQKKQIVNRSITTMPTNVSNTDKTNDKPKSKSKPGKVIEG